ncbi:DUF401 family protein [Verrucomicrobiota bacterium]
MPAILKILTVFIGMLFLTRVRVPLGLSLVLGSFTVNIWAGLSMREIAIIFLHSLIDFELWIILAITVLILEIGRFMTKKENADELLAATQRWGGRHGRACSIMAIPAMIGLVPMPAGALFSAPFVKHAGNHKDSSAQWKSAVNYWFRHIWEYWWPLYPGVIIAMSLFEMIDTWQFIYAQMLFTPVAAFAGYFFLIHPHIKRLHESQDTVESSNWKALYVLSPIIIVFVLGMTLHFPLQEILPNSSIQTRKLLAMLIGLTAGLIVVILDLRKQRNIKLFSTLLSLKSLNLMFSLAGVMVFKFMLKKSGLLPMAAHELVNSNMPVEIAIAALPFLAGLVTGISLAFVGTSFPLVVGLMAAEGTSLTPLATLVLAYGFGYMGMMLSPVHLCLLVTKDYFGASIGSVYKQIAPCVISMLIYCLAIHILFKTLGW